LSTIFQSYPLLIPEPTDIEQLEFSMQTLAAISVSPFSATQQVYLHPGQYWRANVRLVAQTQQPASVWLAFLGSLYGRYGTFYMGPPKKGVPNGAAAQSPGNPRMLSSSQSGANLNIYGATSSVVGYLLPGDFISVGTGTATRMHITLNTVSTISGGIGSLQLWPMLKPLSVVSGAEIRVQSAMGIWRLATNEPGWSEDYVLTSVSEFEVVEAL
jgi:hypothetical protein